jgi:LysM repeat protein
MRTITRGLIVIMAFLLTLPVFAQGDTQTEIPEAVDLALASLSQRLREDVTFETVAAFNWERQQFADTSLGCPEPGQVYAEVVTPGYQVDLTYAGTVYDYRVSEDGEQVILCDTSQAVPVEPTPDAPIPPCGESYVVQPDDTLIQIAEACDTTVDALMAVNPDIPDPSLIYSGQRLAIPSGDVFREVSIAPDSGVPGSPVQVFATGFPPGAQVQIGLGRYRSEYDVIATREIGVDGSLSTQIAIPEFAEVDEQWVAVVVLNQEEYISEIFEVVAEDPGLFPTPQPTEAPDADEFTRAQIFLVARGDAGRTGQLIGCDDSLIPVEVVFEPTEAPLTAALNELLAIESRTYGQSGLYNALYRSDLTLEGINIVDGEAVIQMTGELVIGGVCDAPRIEQQIRQTALRYDTIDSVSIFINGQPLSEVLSAR